MFLTQILIHDTNSLIQSSNIDLQFHLDVSFTKIQNNIMHTNTFVTYSSMIQ